MPWYQEWFGEEYLELYAHRDDEEARRQVAFFREHAGRVDGVVLDLACGTGRHLTELNAEGYDAVGCDLSFTLLRTGIDEYGPLPGARADMRALPFGSDSVDGFVNFFTCFGYVEAVAAERHRAHVGTRDRQRSVFVDACSQ